MTTDATWDTVAEAGRQDGADHAAGILAAYECGAIVEAFESLDDIMEEWGTTDHLDYASDVLPAVIPNVWAKWTAGAWTDAVDRECDGLWALYRERFADAFMARVYRDAARWHAVATNVGGAR